MDFENFQHLKVWRDLKAVGGFVWVFTNEDGLYIDTVYTKNLTIPSSVENYVDYNDVTCDPINLEDEDYQLVAIEIIPIKGYHNYQLVLDHITQVTDVYEIYRNDY
jgi:flavin-dependent dehydrogenase